MIHSFDEQGFYLSSSIHPVDPVTKELAMINEAVATTKPLPEFNPAESRLRMVDGEWVVIAILPEPPAPEPEPPTLDELKQQLTNQIDAIYSAKMSVIAVDYPQLERESWTVQIEEARKLIEDPTSDTPWIDACAAARGIAREDLAQRIVSKDLTYRQVSGSITGARHRHEDQIAELPDTASAETYDPQAGWPF